LSDHEDEGLSIPGRWVNSHDLLPGDVLLTRDGRRARLQVIHQRYEEQFRVVNLTIAEHHTFAVGAAAILVHNTSGCGRFRTSAPGRTELPILNPHFAPKPTTLGRVGEALAETTGRRMRIVINGRARIPDSIDRVARVVYEVKNVKRLSYTRQLRDYVDYAKEMEYRFELWVPEEVARTGLSGPLREAIKQKDIILKIIPGL